MPLGNPEGPTQSQWMIRVASSSLVGEYAVPFEIKATPDNPDADGVYEIVQRLIDHIDASPDFRVVYATRDYGYQQRITPTE